MQFARTYVEYAVTAIEVLGVTLITAGAFWALALAALALRKETGQSVYRQCRHRLGRSILLGLELLVAADIINTVAVEPTLRSVGVLTIIVLIRIILSFSLEVETTGRWPWQPGSEP